MTIYISTSLSSELTRAEQLSILIKLHKNNLNNLHVSFEQNKLIIYSDNNTFEHQMMGLIDSNKADAITHFKSTFFANVECEITAVNRYAFLPRSGSISFTSMIESALRESPNAGQNANAILAFQRFQSIQKRQAEILRDDSSSDLFHNESLFEDLHDNESPDSYLFANNGMIPPHLDNPHARFGHVSSPTMFGQMQSTRQRPQQRRVHQHIHDEYEQKIEQQKQHTAYEGKLVGLYESSMQVATTNHNSSKIAEEIMSIPCPKSATTKESQNRDAQGVALKFDVNPALINRKSLITENDVDLIKLKLLEVMGALSCPSSVKYCRNVMGQITSFEIAIGVLLKPQALNFFIRDVQKALYITATESEYQVSSITLTNPQKTPTATTTELAEKPADPISLTAPVVPLVNPIAVNSTLSSQPPVKTANKRLSAEIQRNSFTRELVFNQLKANEIKELYETTISFRLLFTNQANLPNPNTIEQILPMMAVKFQEVLSSLIFCFEAKPHLSRALNTTQGVDFELKLLTSHFYATDSHKAELVTNILTAYNIFDPSNKSPISNSLLTESIRASSVLLCGYQIELSAHPLEINRERNHNRVLTKTRYEFLKLKKLLSHDDSDLRCIVLVNASPPSALNQERDINNNIVRTIFNFSKWDFTLFASITMLTKPSPQITRHDEEKLNQLLALKYKNTNSLSEKLWIEEVLRLSALNGIVEDVSLILKFKEKFSLNLDAENFDSPLPFPALHLCFHNDFPRFSPNPMMVGVNREKHIECAKLLLVAGARADLEDIQSVTVFKMITDRIEAGYSIVERLLPFLPSQQHAPLAPIAPPASSIATQPTLMRPRTDPIEALYRFLNEKYPAERKHNLKLHAEEALRVAALRGNISDVKLILQYKEKLSLGIDNVSSTTLSTALHQCVAAYSDKTHVACAKLLIDAGASVDIPDKAGVTVRSIIESKENSLLDQLSISPLPHTLGK